MNVSVPAPLKTGFFIVIGGLIALWLAGQVQSRFS